MDARFTVSRQTEPNPTAMASYCACLIWLCYQREGCDTRWHPYCSTPGARSACACSFFIGREQRHLARLGGWSGQTRLQEWDKPHLVTGGAVKKGGGRSHHRGQPTPVQAGFRCLCLSQTALSDSQRVLTVMGGGQMGSGSETRLLPCGAGHLSPNNLPFRGFLICCEGHTLPWQRTREDC